MVNLGHNGGEEQVHEFPTRSPSGSLRSPKPRSPISAPTTVVCQHPRFMSLSPSSAQLPLDMSSRRYARTTCSPLRRSHAHTRPTTLVHL